MKLTRRTYRDEEDYWRIRTFLRQLMLLNQQQLYSWHVARLDYWFWFINPHLEKMDLRESLFLWEDTNGNIASVLLPEGLGQAHANIHPQYDQEDLLVEMISTAEKHLRRHRDDGSSVLWFFSLNETPKRRALLKERGFLPVEKAGVVETQHRRVLNQPLPEIPVIPGYQIRPLGTGLEVLERCYASGLGFHDDDIAVARDNRDNPRWFKDMQMAPLYRRDLDLAAFAADGSMASFCTIWFDDFSRTACFEPIATVPAHQRKGLARALMLEGLQRLQKMGCQVAFVGGYSEHANALYYSVMGEEHTLLEPWQKVWPISED